LNSALLDTLIKRKNFFPMLATGLALGYLLHAIAPLLTPLKTEVEQEGSQVPESPSLSESNGTEKEPQDFLQISEWHLFGHSAPVLSPSEAGVTPQTQLELKLQGIFYLAQHQKNAHAIIESPDQIQKTYKINDELPGGAILQAIENEKIIILINNRQEFLSLERNKSEPPVEAPSVEEPLLPAE
jgi:general secretion pathway protein C